MTTSPGKPNAQTKSFAQQIRTHCMAYIETREDFPWGHSAFKVKGKTFVFMSADDTGLGMSVKLTASHTDALHLPFTEPTHYGMGKHGWVSASFGPNENVPIPLLKGWIDESFKNVAPKLILKRIAAGETGAPAPKAKKKAAKTVAKKKTAKKVAKKPAKKKTVKKKTAKKKVSKKKK